jgi:hypothetical protein
MQLIPRKLLTKLIFLRTNSTDLTDEWLWKTYIMLNTVDDGFRCLKSELGLRPNFYQKGERIVTIKLSDFKATYCFDRQSCRRPHKRRIKLSFLQGNFLTMMVFKLYKNRSPT